VVHQPVALTLYAVSFDGSDFWAAGSNGRLFRSSDAVAWSEVDSPVEMDVLALLPQAPTEAITSLNERNSAEDRAIVQQAADNRANAVQIQPSEIPAAQDPTGGQSREPLKTPTENSSTQPEPKIDSSKPILLFGSFGAVDRDGNALSQSRFPIHRALETKGRVILPGGSGRILTGSVTDGFTEIQTPVQTNLLGAATDGKRWVVTGEGGTILLSIDGTTWTVVNSPTRQTLRSVAYGNGRFIAVGSGGTVLMSPDGERWRERDPGTTTTLNDVVFADGQFVVVGNRGLAIHSSDGVAWVLAEATTESNLNAVTYGRGFYVAVGAGGTVLTSPDAINWTRRESPGAKNKP
jgi:hypothetical protein